MAKLKTCIDIGGTKILFCKIDEKLNVVDQIDIDTPKTREELLPALVNNVVELDEKPKSINVAFPGRVDKDGKIMLSANVPLAGENLKLLFSRISKRVYIENDSNCFAINEIMKGGLRNGLALVWGTGIGGTIVVNGKIYKGAGLASEPGHMRDFDSDFDLESIIGGKAMNINFGMSGEALQEMALSGDIRATEAFNKIGVIFGNFLASMSLLLDPETVVLGGSFAKSWDFMRNSVMGVILTKTIRKSINVRANTDKFYVAKGAYLIDNYAKFVNKL